MSFLFLLKIVDALFTPPEESRPPCGKKEKNVEKLSEIVENEESKNNISTSTVDNKEEKRYKNNKILVSYLICIFI